MSSKTPDPMAVEEVAIRAAMRRRLNELQGSAASLADPRRWIKEQPLASCLVAAGAGVALGLLAGGRKPSEPGAAATGGHNGSSHHKEHQTLGAMLAASLVPTLQPMISDLIHSAIGGRTAGGEKTADVTEDSMASGLAEDNKVVD